MVENWLFNFLAIIVFAIIATVLIQLVDDLKIKKILTTVTYVIIVLAIFFVLISGFGYLRLPR